VYLHRQRTETDAAESLSCRLYVYNTVVDKMLHK